MSLLLLSLFATFTLPLLLPSLQDLHGHLTDGSCPTSVARQALVDRNADETATSPCILCQVHLSQPLCAGEAVKYLSLDAA